MNLIEQVTAQMQVETRAYALEVDGPRLLPLSGTSFHPNSYDVAWSPDSGTTAALGSEADRYVVAVAQLDGSAPVFSDIDSSYSGPTTSYIAAMVWNPSAERLFYAITSCGRGGCGNSQLHMVDLGAAAPPQPITDGGARFLGYVP
jgi:hypothetical protein